MQEVHEKVVDTRQLVLKTLSHPRPSGILRAKACPSGVGPCALRVVTDSHGLMFGLPDAGELAAMAPTRAGKKLQMYQIPAASLSSFKSPIRTSLGYLGKRGASILH